MSLVSYGNSSSSDDSSSEDGEDILPVAEETKKKLQLPDLDALESTGKQCETPEFKSVTSSIFANPFRKEEEDKLSILSRHVKLSEHRQESGSKSKKGDTRHCYKYLKGKCRFGDKCKFVHADTATTKSSQSVVKQDSEDIKSCTPQNPAHHPAKRKPELIGDLFNMFDDNDDEAQEQSIKKRRPGLQSSLIPSKKVMKMYHKHKV
eukprot:gene14254-15741_t